MKLIQRVGYYLGGFSIGLIFLAFFLSGKRVSCSYGANARVIKNINIKPLKYSDESIQFMQSYSLDTTIIKNALLNGNVDFPYKKTEFDSCKIYLIENTIDKSEILLTIENCDSIATLKKIVIK